MFSRSLKRCQIRVQVQNCKKAKMIVIKPNPFYPTHTGVSTRKTKKLEIVTIKSKKAEKKSIK
jgi:hypothetical protein